MGFCKTLAILVAVVAVLIGIVGKNKPEVFLNIPEMGFVPFMLMGGNKGILPPYFDTDPWLGDNPKEWLKDGDIVIATAPKAGTTWMCYCMDAVRRKGSDKVGLPYTDIMLSTPWMEIPQQPGQLWAERKEMYNSTVLPDGTKLKDYWDNAAFPFRIFKSHYYPRGTGGSLDVLPVKEMPNVKFLVTVRNPLEVAKSVHSFFPKHKDEFRKMWGGFPPMYANAEDTMKAMYPGRELDTFFFSYVRSWWPYIGEPNVLALHYTDMVRDTPGLVDKLAKFAGVSLNSEEKAKVVEKCSFKHMKENSNLFDYKLPLNKVGADHIMQAGTHINKGKSDGEAGISEEGLKDFSNTIEKEITDPKMKKWSLEGGPL